MNLLHTIFLGIVEGVTEFLPISSTAHLDIARALLSIQATDFVKSFEIIIQFGAILAVVVLFWKKFFKSYKYLRNIVIAFIPTGIIGFILYKLIKSFLLGNIKIEALTLFLGGIIILIFEYRQKKIIGENLPKEEIENLLTEHEVAPHQRALQKKLAQEVTTFVHSKEDYDFAIKASEILFGNDTAEMLQSLSEEQLLQVMEGVPTVEINKQQLDEGYDLVSLLADTHIFPSKGEARKMWIGGGIGINKVKVNSEKSIVNDKDLLQNKYILIQKGKKNYYLVKVI